MAHQMFSILGEGMNSPPKQSYFYLHKPISFISTLLLEVIPLGIPLETLRDSTDLSPRRPWNASEEYTN